MERPLEPLPLYGNRWKKHHSVVKYQNAWITVREDAVTRPDGNPGIYGVIEARIATAVVAIDQGQVWLVGQHRYPINIYSWEIIEGGSNEHETALQAAKRELLEEAHVCAKQWVQLGAPFYLSNCFSSEIAYAFLASDLTTAKAHETDPTEDLRLMQLPFSEIASRVQSGEISDALSIIAINRASAYLQKSILHRQGTI